jgi:hypothetical protein
MAVNEILPVPLLGIPIAVLLLAQLNIITAVGLVKGGTTTVPLAQIVVISAIGLTIGAGQFDDTQFPLPVATQVLPTELTEIATFCPGDKPVTVNVVPDTVPVTGVPDATL